MDLNPEIWGPHYWFFLQSIAITYPTMPNEVTKKKYYDFIQNIPLFIPHKNVSKIFLSYLDKYPVTPYLDSRESFLKWTNFIHNKINMSLGKSIVSVDNDIKKYYEEYKPKELQNNEAQKARQKIIFSSIIVLAILTGYFMYNK